MYLDFKFKPRVQTYVVPQFLRGNRFQILSLCTYTETLKPIVQFLEVLCPYPKKMAETVFSDQSSVNCVGVYPLLHLNLKLKFKNI